MQSTETKAPVQSQRARRGLLGSELFLAFFVVANPTLIPTCLTYRNDVERTCDAEHLSGIAASGAAKGSGPKIIDWLKKNVATPEGVILVNELATKGALDQAVQLRGEARRYGIAACPYADTLDAEAKEEAVQEDVASLCAGRAIQDSGVAMLDISTAADDAERLREILDWSIVNLKTPEGHALVTRVAAKAPKARGLALRTESAKSGVARCALADAIDQPLPVVVRPPLPVLPTFTVTKYEGDRKYQNTATDTIVTLGDAINNCYASGLAGNPKLAGKIAVHVSLDATGNMKDAKDDGSTLPDRKVIKCVVDGVANADFPHPPVKGGGAPKFTVTLTLAPTHSPAAPNVAVQQFEDH